MILEPGPWEKETPSRSMTVTSSLNEISMDKLGKNGKGGGVGGGRQLLARLHPFIPQASKLKDRDDIPLLLERKK